MYTIFLSDPMAATMELSYLAIAKHVTLKGRWYSCTMCSSLPIIRSCKRKSSLVRTYSSSDYMGLGWNWRTSLSFKKKDETLSGWSRYTFLRWPLMLMNRRWLRSMHSYTPLVSPRSYSHGCFILYPVDKSCIIICPFWSADTIRFFSTTSTNPTTAV